MIPGMDFGTTNSGIGVYDGRSVQLISFSQPGTDSAPARSGSLRTALYLTNQQDVYIGRAAVDHYFAHNTGRPVKLKKVPVGEVEIFGADMYFVIDLHTYIDLLSPGRLFLSIKSSLRDSSYAGTVIGSYFYTLEDLIAIYLYATRLQAEQQLGQTIREIVLGRPVYFDTDPEKDKLAQHRLLQAAFRAGYEVVHLQYEPVAAAYSYAQTLSQPEQILVFDFGGGTLDLTVMRLGGDAQPVVLSTGGVPIAGDVFDQKLIRQKLPPHFGSETVYGSRQRPLTMPLWIYDRFSSWQTILELQSQENREILTEIIRTARQPKGVARLLSLVENNESLQLFDQVEASKRELSEKIGTMIRIDGQQFSVRELITRAEFELMIQPESRIISQSIDACLEAAGITPAEIDHVISTGGSSRIPLFQSVLEKRFGREKLRQIDTFSSVTAGLAISAYHVSQGQLTLPRFTPPPPPPPGHTQVPPVHLPLLFRRLQAQYAPASAADDRPYLIGQTGALDLTAVSTPDQFPRPLPELGWPQPELPGRLHQAAADTPLLLMTNQYRFLLISVRQIADLARMKLPLSTLFTLSPQEAISSVSSWLPLKQAHKLLILTSLGFARAYPMSIMSSSIEAAVPYQFDTPLPGEPIAVLPLLDAGSQQLILATDSGRALRFPLSALPHSGINLLHQSAGNLVSAHIVTPETEVALITASGYGRISPVSTLPQQSSHNSKGLVVISRRPLISLQPVREGQPIQLYTSQQLLQLDPGTIWRTEEAGSKSRRLLKLAADELVVGMILPVPATP